MGAPHERERVQLSSTLGTPRQGGGGRNSARGSRGTLIPPSTEGGSLPLTDPLPHDLQMLDFANIRLRKR